jgi:flagellar biosynthesis anti-sigma factor FlgM
MKIEHDKLSLHTGGAEAPARATGVAGGTGAGAPASAARGDALTLSPELRQMQAAIQAAHDQPAVRAEVVARMRELLERGELGRDATALADALVDGAIAVE